MSSLTVYNATGASVGQIEVPEELLVLDKGGEAVRQAVVAHMAACRAGTASTLRKGEVRGSNRKPWRQKGLGRARAGYRQSPVWRGGSVAFGPHPRSYDQKVNRKVARLAFRRALSEKIAAGAVRVVEALQVPAPKTREFAGLMKGLGVSAPALFVVDGAAPDLARASRNIPGVELVGARDVSTYQLLRYPVVVVAADAVDMLKRRLGAQAAAGGEGSA